MSQSKVAIMMGSDPDLPIMTAAAGVPIDSSPLNGFDSLLSTVQMPAGIPVATVAIGKSGAKNAGILAVQILALSDPELQKKLAAYKMKLSDDVKAKNEKLKSRDL